ncbi:ABC transporter substrate-binding protein [Paenibacillus methanolicus]|uniref:Putative aldouronate transport system substrate-binding protein n=1 Tax=Paenibacillus methanolicus TaxID=582686 RepID=A0A5S5CG40_9BACL|nr:ABC transporter substrate-binding protein [Paenibacillus methanolicus]TYP77492.1 putative aldouronate transport system substrate-binding protein [Paenibacillus methanolicus]
MKASQKKAASLLMIGTLLVAAGCSDRLESDRSSSPDESPEKAIAPMTITFASGDNNPLWDDMQSEVGKFITEKTGISIKAQFPGNNTDTDMFALMVASNEYPDMVSAKVSVGKLKDAGALIDLTPLIDAHAPNIKKLYGEYMKRLRWSNDDHGIYVLPTAPVNQTYFKAGSGFELQHAVLKELGYPQIKTVKDFEHALKTYYNKHKTTADGQPIIPLSLNGGEWQFLISVTNPAVAATGASDDGEFYIDPDTYEAKLHYLRPEEKEYFRWLNHMHDIGLLDPESFVQKVGQYRAKIASGRVLGLIDADWDFAGEVAALKKEGKIDQTYAHFPVTLNESFKRHDFQSTGYLAGIGISITKSAKDPVRVIQFLDYLASDEGQILINWGIEGKHYKVENGKRVIPEDISKMKVKDNWNFRKTTGVDMYRFGPSYGDGVKDPTGNYYTPVFPEQIEKEYTQADRETLAAYKVKSYKDLWPSEKQFPVKPWGSAWTINMETGSEANVIFQQCQAIVKKRITQAILSKPEQFDAIWDDFMKELEKAGVEKLNEAYTKLVKDRVKLWNE